VGSANVAEADFEECLARFETAYLQNSDADLTQFLPPPDHPLSCQIAVELIRCDMELSWKQMPNRISTSKDRY
jgi:hypothetical protein